MFVVWVWMLMVLVLVARHMCVILEVEEERTTLGQRRLRQI